VLVNVLDPNDQQHTDSTRLIALSILNAALEAGGPTISRFPSLESIILDPGCKFLFQLARSENFSVLHLTLRTITTVFETMRSHLKLQQELFLSFTIDRLAPPQGATSTGSRFLNNVGNTLHRKTSSNSRPSTPLLGVVELESSDSQPPPTPPRLTVPPAARGEVRDLLLETLAQLSRHPGFMVDLYTNYDCDINCENLFERLVDFLTKGVYPLRGGIDSQLQHQNSQYLCLELLLSFVNDMAMRHETVRHSFIVDLALYTNPFACTCRRVNHGVPLSFHPASICNPLTSAVDLRKPHHSRPIQIAEKARPDRRCSLQLQTQDGPHIP
jgi:golgi-specific brefeldin A-resistance guanine nucleotide exchange factor 1